MIATSLFLALSPAAQPQEPEHARLEMKPVEIGVGDGTKTAYRGTLRVPLVRANPGKKEIGVDVWRFPAADGVPEGRLPVFRLHGGPGWPGLEPGDIDWSEIEPMLELGDLVIVGQRGIGTSTNTSCNEFAKPIDPDLPLEEQTAAIREQCTECREHWEDEGYDIKGFSVLEAAADVNDVRRLLGYDKIVLMGGSFGSHWGMTVMRFHPEAVARAVLHGMEGPDHTYDGPGGLLKALERIAEAAEGSAELKDKLPEEGLIDAFRFVIDQLEEDPFGMEVDGVEVPLDAYWLRELSMGYTSSVRSRRSVGGWPGDIMRLYEGNFEPIARVIASRRRPGGGLPTASFFGLDCGSGITRERLERYQNDPAVKVVGDPTYFYEAACPAWGVDLGDDFRADFVSKIPTVIVHGTWDVSTPFDNALELVHCFENLNFIPVEGGTHGAFREAMQGDAAFSDALMNFLSTGETEKLPSVVELPPIAWTASW